MTTYILRRLLINIPVLLGITVLVFLFIALAPGESGGFFTRVVDDVWMWFKGDADVNVSSAAPQGG